MKQTLFCCALLLMATPAVHASNPDQVLLVGDSYMVGMEPFFRQVWPGAQPVAKIGAGVNSPAWQSLGDVSQFGYVFVSLGINDLPAPSQAGQVWADGYASRVAGFVRRFDAATHVHWIVPPCPVGRAADDIEAWRWEWLRYAITQGVKQSARKAYVVELPNTVCSHRTADQVHYTQRGYLQIVRGILGVH